MFSFRLHRVALPSRMILQIRLEFFAWKTDDIKLCAIDSTQFALQTQK